MKPYLFLPLMVLCCIFPCALVAEDLKLEELLQRHVEAMGGPPALGAIQTLKLSGKSVSEGEGYDLVLVRKKPNLVRFNILKGDVRLVIGYDGSQSWHYYENSGERSEVFIGAAQYDSIVIDSYFWPPTADYSNPAYALTHLEDESIGGKNYHVVGVVVAGIEGTEKYYLDVDTLLLSRRVIAKAEGGHAVTEYSDYRPVNGVQIPHSIASSDKNGEVEIRFDTVSANRGVFDSYFEAP